MTLDPDNSTQLFSAGDAGIAGKLSVSLAGFGPGELQVGDLFPILTVGGSLGGVDFSDPLYPKVDLSAAPFFSQVSFPNLVALGLRADDGAGADLHREQCVCCRSCHRPLRSVRTSTAMAS